jgi:hypothetical protein
MQDNGEDEDENHHPCLEDEDCFGGRPDPEETEEAIGKLLDGFEEHEGRGFDQLQRLLGDLPVPVQKEDGCMSHKTALEGGFIPEMEMEELKQTHILHISMYWHVVICTRLYLFILTKTYFR